MASKKQPAKKAKQAKKGKKGASAADSREIRLSTHPKAKHQIRLAKSWGGLIGFALASYAAWKGGLPFVDTVVRGLVWGVKRREQESDAVVGDEAWFRSPAILGAGAIILVVILNFVFR